MTIDHAVSASFTGEYSYLSLYYYARNGLLFGRGTCGGSLVQAARFLRRHVLTHILQDMREGRYREFSRRSLVLSTAIAHYAIGRFGVAPGWLVGLSRSWSGAVGDHES